jgi:hypothetical protein
MQHYCKTTLGTAVTMMCNSIRLGELHERAIRDAVEHCSAIGEWQHEALAGHWRNFTVRRLSVTHHHRPSCPLSPLHPPHSPTLRPFSTPLWLLTNVKPRETWHRIRSFLSLNPAIPPTLSSPSFAGKSPRSANPRMATIVSQNGLCRP